MWSVDSNWDDDRPGTPQNVAIYTMISDPPTESQPRAKLYGINSDGTGSELQGTFRIEGSRVVYYPAGSDEPYPDQLFLQSFGDRYLAPGPNGMVEIRLNEPEEYVRHLPCRFSGQSWAELEE